MKYWQDKATGLYGVKMESSGTYNGTAFTSTETYSYDPWAPLFPPEIGKEVETVRHHHTALHKALQTAVEWGLLSRNVADAVSLPHMQRLEMKIWGEDDIIYWNL